MLVKTKGETPEGDIYMKNDYTTIEKAYEVLKPNEKRWLMDADYRRKYEYVRESELYRRNGRIYRD